MLFRSLMAQLLILIGLPWGRAPMHSNRGEPWAQAEAAPGLPARPQTPSRLRYSLGSMPISRLNSAEKRLAQV